MVYDGWVYLTLGTGSCGAVASVANAARIFGALPSAPVSTITGLGLLTR